MSEFRFTDAPRFSHRTGERMKSLGLGYRRHLAEKAYDALLAQHGPDHPATHGALGRFVALWGEDFLEMYNEPIPEGSEAFDRALFRETGADGQANRRMRRHENATRNARTA